MIKRRSWLFAGVGSAVLAFLLLAPLSCCSGIVAFEYQEPDLFQPQTVITAVIVGILTGSILWLLTARPRISMLAKVTISLFLFFVTFVLALLSLGGGIIYGAPVLVPIYWWLSHQSGLIGRSLWALLGGLISVEALTLVAYETVDPRTDFLIVIAGIVVAGLIFIAPLTARSSQEGRPSRF